MVKAPLLLIFILNKARAFRSSSTFQKLQILILLFLLTSGVAISQASGSGGGNAYGDAENELIARKYALKIGVSVDSLEFLSIYQVMDKWPEFVAANPDKIGGNIDAVFGQFMYYLAFRTKIPADVKLLFKDRKAYLFKNLIYLRPGDLLFYGESPTEPERVAFYLQNNYVVYPDTEGKLQFEPYEKLQEAFSLTAAKIDRDE